MATLGEQITFGPFLLDSAANRLRRDGADVELRRQAFHALRALIENPGRYVDYEQMIHQAWDGVVVSRHTVAVTVGEVKKALQEYGGWINYRPRLGYRFDIPRCEELVRRAWHFWYRHTREGFEKAICCFQQAIQEDSSDFRGYEGLASCYLMLGTHGMRHPSEMYSKFREMHARAVALGGLTPELRADRAHGWHTFEHRIEEAEAELLQAQREKFGIAAIHIRLAMVYASTGRVGEALEALRTVRISDSLCPLLASAEIVVYFCARDFAGAVESAQRAIDLHPYSQLARTYYGKALEFAGDTNAALEQYQRARFMSPELPWVRALEARCMANGGETKEALSILCELEELRETEYVDPYHLALLLDALKMRDRAFDELERAYREQSSMLFLLDIDPKIDCLRSDPRFALLRSRVFGTLTEGLLTKESLATAHPA
jgi:DNA-binding winged helix-turn-helix (wHTH) protein